MTRVLIWPFPTEQPANHGIGRVVYAQYKYLPEHGIELTRNPADADVIACHTNQNNFPDITVLHCHGAYWTGDPGSGIYHKWHEDANAGIASAARRARAITVPSRWVGEVFRRDMRINPTIIGHGIELDEWSPGENAGYILWGKNRATDVCNPQYAYDLALHGEKVVSTFAPDGVSIPGTMKVTGDLPHSAMRELIRNADVYLATTKETFGIGTLEAMACGVPILGYAQGGTKDIVRHEIDGYLAQHGDIDDLLLGLAYIRKHRAVLSANAQARAREYTWPKVIAQYADLYHQLADTPERSGVTVVVPCHNYGRYLAQCLESLLNQSYRPEQIIVIDDGSTDDTTRIAGRYKMQGVHYVYQVNSGVAAARNHGLSLANHPFVICLDADDQLAPRYVEVCRKALMQDRALGVAYTGLEVISDMGHRQRTGWPPEFSWESQSTVHNPPSSCIPSAAMFRRSMWERAGGYKQEYAPAEDTEFWTRGLSVGFTAKRVTDSPWFIYRSHPNSASRTRKYRTIDDWLPWMRDRNYPFAAPSPIAPKVRSYSTPKVSVVIPVGPGHAQYLPQAIESLLGQTLREWEVIVCNDTAGIAPDVLRPYPFAKVVTVSANSAGAARNAGLKVATAPLILWLDADDYLHPEALAKLCKAYSNNGGKYIYGDWTAVEHGQSSVVKSAEYTVDSWLDFSDLGGKHIVTVLMAVEDARKVGGFDETLAAWEDWDFFTKCAIAGIHGQRIPEQTLVVRRDTGTRTKHAFAKRDTILRQLAERYAAYTKGTKAMAACCGGNGAALLAAKMAYDGTPIDTGGLSLQITTRNGRSNGMVIQGAPTEGVTPVRMEFVGERQGAVTYNGNDGRQYRGGNNPLERYANVHPADVGKLASTGDWRVLAVPVLEAEPVRETVKADPVAVAEVDEPEEEVVEELAPVETATGRVKRKRVTKKVKDTPLKDLSPLDE